MFTAVAGSADDARSAGVSGGFADADSLKVDEDQLESFQKIVNLLISGGYFRAMIKTLDDFDKVAGGLAWCITAANENVDIVLLFEEHSRMGEKITVSENIERALVGMKCPFPLQAQQILHLDCINIYPAIQWLVGKVIEVRKQTGDLVRVYSETQFENYSYKMPSEKMWEESIGGGLNYLNETSDKYAPKRTFRAKTRRGLRKAWKTKQNEEERVHSVLLEYGQAHLYTMALLQPKDEEEGKGKKQKTGLKIPGAGEDEQAQRENEARIAKERGDKILKNMGRITDDNPAVVKAALNDMMKAKSEEMNRAKETIAGEMKEIQDLQSQVNEKEHGQFNHQRYIHDVEKKIKSAEDQVAQLKVDYEKKKQELNQIQGELMKKVELNKKIIDEIDKLNAIEQTPESKKKMAILQELVALNENLKRQVASFKENCKDSREDWQKKIGEIKTLEPNDGGRGEQILKTHIADSEKLNKLREFIVGKNREIASVKRKIDQVPSRRELQQYQRQFVEVFEQMAVKYTETKQYYNLFNYSEKMRVALEHEDKLLNSIQEQYPTVKGSKKGRERFLASLKDIIAGMEQRAAQAAKLFDEETLKRNTLDEKYVALVEKERHYYAAAKAYQEECKKTELLEDKIKKAREKKKGSA